jgi:Kef-type K+ transport system membrane component KefB
VRRPLLVYLATLLVFGGGIFAALEWGRRLEAPASSAISTTAAHEAPSAGAIPGPLPTLLLQIIVIVGVARLTGAAFRRIGQPGVIGEIVAGILVGPSVLGALAPGAFAFLFPPHSTELLQLFAQIGVILFLFAVGLELDLDLLRRRARTALFVSHASIVVPYFLGVVLALGLYREFAPPGTRFLAFGLFMGIALSITAFPVLVRILHDRGLIGTPLGNTAVTCAAVDDVTAWTLLAAVVALSGARDLRSAGLTLALTIGFIVAMLFAIGPALRRALGAAAAREEPGKAIVAVVLVFLLAASLTTELIGIHALFGAFLAGVVMPRSPRFRAYFAVRLEEFSSVFLLPLFFAFTGLRTRIGLLGDARGWLFCGLVVLVATAGKLGGSMVAARMTGTAWGDAFALGALMNSRGLMELIALNVGYELGILSPRIFAVLVLMAIVTTFATAPLLALSARFRSAASADGHGQRVVVQGDQRA